MLCGKHACGTTYQTSIDDRVLGKMYRSSHIPSVVLNGQVAVHLQVRHAHVECSPIIVVDGAAMEKERG